MNLPNGLTALRLLLVPVFATLLLQEQGASAVLRSWAAVVFLVASLTDIVDGHLARQRGQVTRFGTIADPIADKVLTGVALVGLSLLGELPWWVTGVLVGRELGVTLLRLWVIRHEVMAPSWGGKAKTFALTVAIMLYLIPAQPGSGIARSIVMTVAVALSLGTAADYLVRALRLRSGGRTRHGDAQAMARALVATLADRRETVAVAESLTGGLLGAAITDIPGASAVFRCGITAYATELKGSLLGVDRELLASEGAIHGLVAEQMASGVRERSGSTYGLATTGVAGPQPQDGHQPGTVVVAVSGPAGTRSVMLALEGDRAAIRTETVRQALSLLGSVVAVPAAP